MSKANDEIVLTTDEGTYNEIVDIRELESQVRDAFSAHITDIRTDETENDVELLAKIHAPDAHSYADKITLKDDAYQLHIKTVSDYVVPNDVADYLRGIGEWDADDVGYVTQPHDMLRINITEAHEETATE